MFYNEDCVTGARKHLADNSVDLIISDPPYGIGGDKLHKHYNRNENMVLDGYIEIPAAAYPEFSRQWIAEAARVLRPGGSLYIVSGYTNLRHVLNALAETQLKEVNHLIWKYNFGVYTKTKYISSHYHLLYYIKPGGKPTFNTHARFGDSEKSEQGGSLNYLDREDVWVINREYQPGKVKNKNTLPTQLLTKLIQYSSNEGDLVADFFLGSFSTAKVAIGLKRRATGFEQSTTAFAYQVKEVAKLTPGYLLAHVRVPERNRLTNQGQPLSRHERERILAAYARLRASGATKKGALEQLSDEFGRGYWSLLKAVDGTTNHSTAAGGDQTSLFG